MTEPVSDKDLSDAIRDLVKRGELDEGAPAYGVALKAIHGGYNSLTRESDPAGGRIVSRS